LEGTVYRRILVPHDGSSFAEQVLPHAVELAKLTGATLEFLEVIAPPNPALFANEAGTGLGAEMTLEVLEEAEEAQREQGMHRLEALARELEAQGIKATWSIEEGDPAGVIVERAAKVGADLITMASHGRSGVIRAILGSVTDAVVRDAHCPVLIIRARED
jgi:nucleotide-binding universal stress UspA family protein